MWNEMSTNFSEPKKKSKVLKEAPLQKKNSDYVYDDD